MKVVHFDVHSGAERNYRAAVEAFDGCQYILVGDPSGLARELPGAAIMIANNRSYVPENAALIREHGKDLKWIQFSTSGVDKAVASGLPPGVVVTNAAGLRSFAVAEHAIALIFDLYRQVRQTELARAGREWSRDRVTPTLNNIAGKTALIIGVGAIGQDIARMLKAFEARVIGISRSTAPLPSFDAIRPRSDLISAAGEADIVLMAATYEPATDKMASGDMFAAMKNSAIFINIARGKLVDEVAMVDILSRGGIAGAGLDVMDVEPLPPDSPLWTMDNVVMTPHIAGAGSANPAGGFESILSENMRRYFAGEPLTKVVIAGT